jgi:glycosyltransferase involved in cell wall biosynthesis
MTRPLVTIGLTAFNAEDTIERALSSALAQTWRPIEVIAVDDASTDRTLSILTQCAQKSDVVKILTTTKNSGASVARNRIFNEAAGEFVALFDDDDVSVPERIERQVGRIMTYEQKFAKGEPVICHTAREQNYPDGSRRIEQTVGTVETRIAPAGVPVARRILMGTAVRDGYGSMAACSQLARTDVYRMVGGYCPEFRRVDDTEFCVRFARAGGHFAGIADPLVVQTMTLAPDKTLDLEKRCVLALLHKHRDLIGDETVYQFCVQWTELKFRWLDKRRASFLTLLIRLGIRHPFLTLQRLRLAAPGLGSNFAWRSLYRGNSS